MKFIFATLLLVLTISLISCQSIKKINENDLSLYMFAKKELKNSVAFSNLIEQDTDCTQVEVSNFLTSPCYSFQYLNEDMQKILYNFDCEQEIDTWGKNYKNLHELSDSKPYCVTLFFSEIIQEKYIIAEIENSNHLPFHTSIIFILEVKNSNEVVIIDTVEFLHE